MKYPDWQKPLFDALAENRPDQLPVKIAQAEVAIKKRLLELSRTPTQHAEMQAIKDGLRSLGLLFPDAKQKKDSA